VTKLRFLIAFIAPLTLGLSMTIVAYYGGNFSNLPGDLGDTRFNLFILEHCFQYFTGSVDEFWNAGFMYPEAEVISLSDNLLGSAPIYALFRLLGYDIFTAFQGWAITLALLNYIAAFLLIQYLSKKTWFAGIAAFIFAFSIGLAAQMNHAQTFPRFAIPLVFLFLLLWKDRLNWKWFFLAALSLTYTFYCGIYLGFTAFVPFAIIFIFTVIKNRKKLYLSILKWRTAVGYGLSVVLSSVFLFKLFAPYMRRAQSTTLHSYSQIKESIPTPLSYISAHPGTLVHDSIENLIGESQTGYWDHWLFPGWFGIIGILMMFTVFFWRKKMKLTPFFKPQTTLLLIAGAITFLVFLRIGDYSLYYFLQLLPGYGAMRSMTRIINIELLFFGIGTAMALSLATSRIKRQRYLVFLIVLPLLYLDNYIAPTHTNTTPKKIMQERHKQLIEKMDHIPKGSVVAYEPDLEKLNHPIDHYQLDAMLAAQAVGLKSINGYSARAAYRFGRYWAKPNPENRQYWLERFEAHPNEKIYVIH